MSSCSLLAARRALDDDIGAWAASVSNAQLAGTLTWFSGVAQREFSRPVWLCVSQMFNHQTHHRGQVSTLLKQAIPATKGQFQEKLTLDTDIVQK